MLVTFFRKKLFKALILFLAFTCATSCEKALELKEPATNAEAVFKDLWQAMDKNYALFGVKGIDWDSTYNQNISKFKDLNSSQLFTQLSKTLEILKDGHVTLLSPHDTFTYVNFYTSYARNFNLNNIKKNYLNNQYNEAGPTLYKLAGGIGYIYYSSFSKDISENDLDKIFEDLSTAKGCIIDVRGNSGGKVSIAERLFSRFINEKKLIRYEMKKSGPGHNDFYDKEPVYVSPDINFYNKPIVLLTNRACFSACNDFVMYMSYLPNVTIVGDQTGGGGSIPADYLLSNGWKLQYSSTVTLSPDNLPIENGIQPDINVGITPFEETIGKDPILEKAIELLQ